MSLTSLKNLSRFLRQGLKDILVFGNQLVAENGNVFSVDMFLIKYHLFLDPKFIKHVLIDHKDSYTREVFIESVIFEHALGKYSLFTSSDQIWKQDRIIANRLFNEIAVNNHIHSLTTTISKELDEWKSYAKENKPLNIHTAINIISMKSILTAAFADININQESSLTLMSGLSDFFAYNKSALYIMLFNKAFLLISPHHRKIRKRLWRLGDELVAKSLASESTENNIVRKLADEYHKQNTTKNMHERLRSEALSIFIGGQETTTSIMVRACVYFSLYPLILQKIREEVAAVIGDNQITQENFVKLNYTRAFVQEILRLHPPVFTIPRLALKDDNIGQYKVAKGDVVFIPNYQIHRMPEYWDNPEGFNPERFLGPHSERNKFCYLPFGAGERVCVGRHLAFAEMLVTITLIVQRYNLSLTMTSSLKHENLFLNRLNRDVMMMVQEREPGK